MVKINKSTDKTAPIYISGPITSLQKLGEDWKQPFMAAVAALRRLGFREIYSPVDIAIGVEAVCEVQRRKQTYADYMRQDLKMLLKWRSILMLRGWEGSKGATLEYQVADTLGMEVLYER
jgi:hypothetical protein